MKRYFFLGIVLLIFSILSGLEYVPNQLIIKTTERLDLQTGPNFPAQFALFVTSKTMTQAKEITPKLGGNQYLITFEKSINANEIELLKSKNIAGIETIQPNYLNKMLITPSDTRYEDQLNYYNMINLPSAWSYTTGSNNVLVAIIDSGIHFDHPDLQSNIFINHNEIPDDGIDNDENGYIDDWRGWDFVDAPELYDIALSDFQHQDNLPEDDLNHGTHLAGIIGGDTDNGTGIAGINWNVKMMILRAGFLTTDGTGYLQDDDAAASIIYAADMGANVINLSWGDTNYSEIIADACQYAFEKGSIIVASAGNTYDANIMYPAKLSTTIAVGAVDKYENRADFSSFGPGLDVVAPGVNVLSTYGEEESLFYSEQSGTSVAAPFVSGVVALLLSVYPDLIFSEVRSFLSESAKDLGDLGYDNEFGFGLLDTENLLQAWNTPICEIISPLDHNGFSANFDIIGSVNASNFSRFAVMYTVESEPDITDWFDVHYPHSNSPHYYYEPVENGVLAQFETNGLNAQNRYYQLRVELITSSGFRYSSYKDVVIDLTEPVIADSLCGFTLRYSNDTPGLYFNYTYDEPVNVELQWPEGGTAYTCNNMMTSGNINLGHYYHPDSLLVVATNSTGLTSRYKFPPCDQPQFHALPTAGFQQIPVDMETVWSNGVYDINNNGIPDLFGMVDPSDEKRCNITEYDGSNYNTLYEFPFTIWPLAMGLTDQVGVEILGLDFDNAYLYDSYGSQFPNYVMWIETNVFGGNFINYDDDPYDEVALIKNKTINFATKRVISLFNRDGLDFSEEYTLINNSETDYRNEFSNRVCSGDFDNDGLKDILTADKDGDIIIYEYDPELDDFIESWQYRLNVQNAFYLEVGDFNGDGVTDFCVGGFRHDYSQTDNSYSSFSFFTTTNEDNQYALINSLYFSEIEQKNALNSFDLDGDDDIEFVIAVPPNIYIVDYLAGKLEPIWVGRSNLDYQNTIAAISGNEANLNYVMANAEIDGEIQNTIIRKQVESSIEPPTGLTVYPIDEESVSLSWDITYNASSYRVYRKHNDDIEFIVETSSTNFFDTGLSTGDTLYYSITSIEEDSGTESYQNAWKQVIPYYIPNLEEVGIINDKSVIIDFDYPLNNESFIVSNFQINNGLGFPSSVIIRNNFRGILLTFQDEFVEGNDYELTMKNLEGSTGVFIPESTFLLETTYDFTTPYIKSYTIDKSKKSAIFVLSEELQLTGVLDLENYLLETPIVDPENIITSVDYSDNENDLIINLGFHKEIKSSVEGYYLHLFNQVDLAGNEMQIADRVYHFNLTEIDNLEHLIVYPNPLIYSKIADEDDFCFRFLNLPRNKKGKICVFDSAGDLIFEDNLGPYFNSLDHYRWYAKNNNSKRISSGMYFYMIEMDGKIKKGKLAVIN